MRAASYILANDQRWANGDVTEIVSASYDEDMLMIGSSPWLGDVGGTGVAVPSGATTSISNRYLFRLCGVQIPDRSSLHVVGIRQLVTLRALIESGSASYPAEREVTSPLWRFADGNVSFHLRWHQALQDARKYGVAPLGTDPNMRGLDTSLLFDPSGPFYTAPGNGVPPGRDVWGLGTWRDMRFPWKSTSWDMRIPVRGPGVLVLYASVRQTDPTTRPVLPPPDDLDAIRPEDRFLLEYPTAVYGRIAGALAVELIPAGSVVHSYARAAVAKLKG